MTLALGIDLGTGGVRTAVIDETSKTLAMARVDYGPEPGDHARPDRWWSAVVACVTEQVRALQSRSIDPRDISRIGVDGTSGSLVIVDDALQPVTRALMYSDGGFTEEADRIAAHVPDPHITRGPGSSLARALRLQAEDTGNRGAHLLHQADFVVARLRGVGGWSDETNTLKLGFDPETGNWPDWFDAVGLRRELLPQVCPAGGSLGPLRLQTAMMLGLPATATVHAGTTDSLAAFLASASLETGAAVTSLGTTLAIKIVSDHRIDAPRMGLYSHRLGNRWLVGGASNTGGGVLRGIFDEKQIAALSRRIDPAIASDLDYYPLSKPGERFPVNDPDLPPRMTPRPHDDAAYLHGLLESIARIEARCYDAVAERGGPRPASIITAGGGAVNPQWTAIRSRVLAVPVTASQDAEAAIGAARLTRLLD